MRKIAGRETNLIARSSQLLGLMLVLITVVVPLVTLAASSGSDTPRFFLEVEGGPVWQTTNDVQIPNDDTGTRFSLVDLVGKGPWPSARLYLTWNINQKHGLRVLLAPFTYKETGVFTSPVRFDGREFAAGAPTEAEYKFNSWRLTYRYRFHGGEQWRWWIGFTAKIRDAAIGLSQEGVSTRYPNTGFVPLLHLAADWQFKRSWHLLLDADALAGGPGRAEDVALKLGWDLCRSWRLSAGYRLLEGGADVDKVYNFAWFHYAVISVGYGF
jgi:hypothetical protein